MKHYWLYVLTLEKGKHYVGITTQTPKKRFQEHVNGIRAAKWTMKYKPVKILQSQDLGVMTRDEAEAYENKAVRKVMKEKGYNNTRGGDLTDEEDYIRRFGRIFLFESWEGVTTVLFLILTLGVVTFMYYTKDDGSSYVPQEPVTEIAASGGEAFNNEGQVRENYSNKVYNFSFQYPSGWSVEESDSATRGILLTIRSDDFVERNPDSYGGTEQGAEFLIGVRELNETDSSIDELIANQQSESELSTGGYEEKLVGGEIAVMYTWAYEGPRRLYTVVDMDVLRYNIIFKDLDSPDYDTYISDYEFLVDSFRFESETDLEKTDDEIFVDVTETFQVDRINIRYFWIYSNDKVVYATNDTGPGHYYVYYDGSDWKLAGASTQAQLECTRDGIDTLPVMYRPPCVENESLKTLYVSDDKGELSSEINARSTNYPEVEKSVYIPEE